MATLNFVVNYSNAYADEIEMCNRKMDALHRDYVEHHEQQNIMRRLYNKLSYKIAYYKWLHFGHKREKLAHRWVEYDGRIFELDWQKIGGAEARRQIADILEKEKAAQAQAESATTA